MKDIKELKPLIKLIKEDKWKLILASIFIFLAELSEIFSGYLNGAAVESITNYNIKSAFIYLGIYFILRVLVDGAISIIADSTLQKVESKLTRKLGYYSYEKAINFYISDIIDNEELRNYYLYYHYNPDTWVADKENIYLKNEFWFKNNLTEIYE